MQLLSLKVALLALILQQVGGQVFFYNRAPIVDINKRQRRSEVALFHPAYQLL